MYFENVGGPLLDAVLPNMAHDEWPMMLCVEVASVGDNHIVLEPGRSHTISTSISAEHL